MNLFNFDFKEIGEIKQMRILVIISFLIVSVSSAYLRTIRDCNPVASGGWYYNDCKNQTHV